MLPVETDRTGGAPICPCMEVGISVFDFHLLPTYIRFNVVLLQLGLSDEANRQDAIEVAT